MTAVLSAVDFMSVVFLCLSWHISGTTSALQRRAEEEGDQRQARTDHDGYTGTTQGKR